MTEFIYYLSDVLRFWNKVDRPEDPSACWNWLGGKDKDGYGFFYLEGKAIIASRFVYELLNGPIPKGLIICHRCDNPSCCNPNHIFAGTHSDNAHDAYNKGRRCAIGRKNGRAVLTEQDVLDIRSSIQNGTATTGQIAKQYRIGQPQVFRIIQHKRWQHI